MPITVTNLTCVYGAGTPFETTALRDVSVTVENGSFVGILGHELGVPVGPGAGVVKKLVKEPEYLLLPGLAVDRDFPGRVELVQADEPGGKTIRQLQPVKAGQHGRPALLG